MPTLRLMNWEVRGQSLFRPSRSPPGGPPISVWEGPESAHIVRPDHPSFPGKHPPKVPDPAGIWCSQALGRQRGAQGGKGEGTEGFILLLVQCPVSMPSASVQPQWPSLLSSAQCQCPVLVASLTAQPQCPAPLLSPSPSSQPHFPGLVP